jgi:hypothetical protein
MHCTYTIHKLSSGAYRDHTTGLVEANEVVFEMQIITSTYQLAAQSSLICHLPCDNKQLDQEISDFEYGQSRDVSMVDVRIYQPVLVDEMQILSPRIIPQEDVARNHSLISKGKHSTCAIIDRPTYDPSLIMLYVVEVHSPTLYCSTALH